MPSKLASVDPQVLYGDCYLMTPRGATDGMCQGGGHLDKSAGHVVTPSQQITAMCLIMYQQDNTIDILHLEYDR